MIFICTSTSFSYSWNFMQCTELTQSGNLDIWREGRLNPYLSQIRKWSITRINTFLNPGICHLKTSVSSDKTQINTSILLNKVNMYLFNWRNIFLCKTGAQQATLIHKTLKKSQEWTKLRDVLIVHTLLNNISDVRKPPCDVKPEICSA